MRVGTGEYLPIKSFSFLIPNPDYNPSKFSQEIEDTEEDDGVRKHSLVWTQNHSKICEITLVPHEFYGCAVEHRDMPMENGLYVRDYNHERVLERIDEVIEKYGGIYKII
jgi:hypothetical protein